MANLDPLEKIQDFRDKYSSMVFSKEESISRSQNHELAGLSAIEIAISKHDIKSIESFYKFTNLKADPRIL